jgi:hypothetical protein
MTIEPDSLPIQLAEGYRVARKNTSIFCALGLGWSAAQFDLKSISLGPAGNLDLSGASVAFILACGIAYTMTRCTIEFAMQTKEVRRWHLAQTDFKLSVFVVRATVLILAASGLSRSVETVLYVAIAALVLLTGSVLLELLFTFTLLPLFIYMTNRRVGKERASTSIASRVMEASSWAQLISVTFVVVLLIGLGIASIQYEPLRSRWIPAPDPLAISILVITFIVVVATLYFQRVWYRKLFANPITVLTRRLPNGTIGVTIKDDRTPPKSHSE